MLAVEISQLPTKVSMFEAVDGCYPDQIRFIWTRLKESVSVLVRCEKQIIPFIQGLLKKRLAAEGKSVTIIDGRADPGGAAGPGGSPQMTRVSGMVSQLRHLVNNTEPNKVFFLPYLDIITSTVFGGLSQEAKEIMTVIHENPMLVLVAFEDPQFPLPELITQAFPARTELMGISRHRLPRLITQEEARKFGKDQVNLMSLFKYVSGLNPIRFREIMGIFAKKADFDPTVKDMSDNYLRELRDYTACGGAALSTIRLDLDIAGYGKVKDQIRKNILSLLQKAAMMSDEKAIRSIEAIIPRGIIFHGPPGTGKTLFAKGIAEALNAAIYIVSGPELKSKWVGEGEANIRRLFAQARATAPAVIVFDEIDSIAAARTGATSDGAGQAAHSMVNQLLTEMDGFRKEELVLVVGTTNFVSSLDPAFLRPGRFEYQIEIPYPEWDDRLAILSLYNQTFELGLPADDLNLLTGWTGRRTDNGTPHTGDHLNALMRDLKRHLLHLERTTADTELLRRWLKEKAGAGKLSPEEEKVVALHEIGHALMFLMGGRVQDITKITLESGSADALGMVESKRQRHPLFHTESQMRAEIRISLGGYAAEHLVFGEVSTGASEDLRKATMIAEDMVTVYGMGDAPAPRCYADERNQPSPYFLPQLSPRIDAILALALQESRQFLVEHRGHLETLTRNLLTSRTLEPADIIAVVS
jgi:cell division protease FtsH